MSEEGLRGNAEEETARANGANAVRAGLMAVAYAGAAPALW